MIKERQNIMTVGIQMRDLLMPVRRGGNRQAIATMKKNDPAKRDLISFTDEHDLMHMRFAALVDQHGNVLNSVTPRTYNPIQNSEIISALDLATDQVGIDVTSKTSKYYKGRSMWRFTGSEPFFVAGDDSPHFNMMDVWHDGRGTGGLKIDGGIFRQWCTNGCTHQVVHHMASVNHRQKVNLLEFFTEAVTCIAQVAGDFMTVHQQAGETEIDLRGDNAVRHALTQIYRDTAPRYRGRLTDTIRRYTVTGDGRDEVGPTVHALIQSVSDVATHQMQDGVARHEWAHAATERLVEAMVAV